MDLPLKRLSPPRAWFFVLLLTGGGTLFSLGQMSRAARPQSSAVTIPSPVASSDSFATSSPQVELGSGWSLESACKIKTHGEEISRPGFRAQEWHTTTVPATVVAALVADGTLPDPYFGMNLRSIPGATYPLGENFSNLAMPKDSPFRCSWWYRTEFRLPAEFAGRAVWLNFQGINNRANVWLNGKRIADANEVAGAYRTYEFDVTEMARQSEVNALAVETIAQTESDLGINWVDWNPAPPDKDMGLWRNVYLTASGPVTIRFPQVTTHFAGGALDAAELTVEAQVRNAGKSLVSGTLRGTIHSISFAQNVELAAGEMRTVRFLPVDFPQLRVAHPKLWWPVQMGTPNLEDLSLEFASGGSVSDRARIRFGIREITSELDEHGHRLFRINGEKLLIRGAGWAPDMLLRESDERLKTEFRYVRDLNLNTIRLEGKMETEHFFRMADENGVLVMAGWSCCDIWEKWDKWKPRHVGIATASLRSQLMRMRSHPSLLAWLNGSDRPPSSAIEKAYIQVLKETDWPNPYLSSASATATPVTGPSGVKMTGPYDYVAPDYWLTADGKYGGAHGFITETSAGPSIPPISSLRKMLPEKSIRSDSGEWNYHAGLLGFRDVSHMEEAMKAIYGPAANVEDYERKAQAMAYDSERAMFEAYSRNKYESTGVIQWMLNNAWPSLIWHLYDYYLQPAGGYFGAKKACEPVHVMYAYNGRSVEVINSRYEGMTGLKVAAEVYDGNLRRTFTDDRQVDLSADGVTQALILPESAFADESPIHFVRLTLKDANSREVSNNFYWVSAKKTVYDWSKTTYRYTPMLSSDDFSALQTLASAEKVEATATIEKDDEGPAVRMKISNGGEKLAFQIHLGIAHRDEDSEILPVLLQDNYFELLPGETREIEAQFLSADALKGTTELRIEGWNITPQRIALQGTVDGGKR